MSFLRRKSKQEPAPAPPKQPLAPLASSPTAPTPLFAKFSTSSNGGGGGGGLARNVSGPMTLSSSTRREPSLKHSVGRSSKEKQSGPSSSWYVPPPQSPDRGSSLSTSPPSTIRNYSRPMPSRTSLKTTATMEDKPLPMPAGLPGRRPSVQQASFSPPPAPAPKTTYNPYGPSSSNVTNLVDDEFEFESPVAAVPVPRPQARAVPNANGVGGGGGPPRLSYAVDLPPEFALFQEFSASSSPPDPSPSRKLNGQHQPAGPYNPTPQPKSILQNPSPPKPLPPNRNVMGSAISTSTSHNSLYPAAIGALQPTPRSMTNPPPAPPSSFSTSNSATPTRASYRRSVHAEPLPGLPPGAGVGPVPGPYIAHGVPGQLFQPPPMMTAPTPMTKGKPRIFAAMGNADEEDTMPTSEQQYAPPQPHLPSTSSPQRLVQPPPLQQQQQQFVAGPMSQSPPPSSSSRQSSKRPQSMAYSQGPLPTLPPQQAQSEIGHGSNHTRQSFVHPQAQPQPQPQQPRRNDSRPLPGPPTSSSPPPRAQSILSNGDRSSIQGSPRTPKKLLKARHRDNTHPADALSRASVLSTSQESFHSTVSHVPSHSQEHSQHGHGIVKTHADGHRTLSKNPHHASHLQNPNRPGSSNSQRPSPSPSKADAQSLQPMEPVEPPVQLDPETRQGAGIELDDDPFAKVEGVKVLSPLQDEATLQEDVVRRQKESKGIKEDAPLAQVDVAPVDGPSTAPAPVRPALVKQSSSRREKRKDETPEEREERRRERRERRAREKEERKAKEREAALLQAASLQPPPTTNGHVAQPSSSSSEIDHTVPGADPEAIDAEPLEPEEPKFFPFTKFLAVPALLGNLLSYMTFYDWCVLSSVSREVRIMLVQSPLLREEVLERFLKTVGYARWSRDEKDPLQLTLQDLADYMRGVSTPSHEYARVARMYVHTLSVRPPVRDPSLDYTLRSMTTSTRAYTRVVLRLRAQAEKEAASGVKRSATPPRSASVPPSSASNAAKLANGNSNGGYGTSRSMSRPPSRAPSPAMSNYSHFGGSSTHVNHAGLAPPPMNHNNSSQTSLTFRSPLFRMRRAPLLRVFVPSPEGDWLSDKSVLDCESELRKCSATGLMRRGDVVWDIAVGDEGNVGRLVYDGKYLLDLDYTYNPIGDLPRYIPTLAFPPSYFHRVIRTGAITSNPIAHVDISPWGEEIAANLQLLQDRVKTETPQGAYHNVVRWVHRSSFAIRPPARVMQRGPSTNGRAPPQAQPHTPRIPIPDTDGLFIDSGWYGTIVVETEGTNEALADLQERCGPRAFPPRPKPVGMNPGTIKAREENRKVWRIMRERSRPGEIWIKAVSVKERML